MFKTEFVRVTMLLAISLTVKGERSLISVNLLYRHGDRTPIDPYPNDPYKVETLSSSFSWLLLRGLAWLFKVFGPVFREKAVQINYNCFASFFYPTHRYSSEGNQNFLAGPE